MKKYYEFYYNLSIAYFISDMDCMYMDRNKFVLSAPAKALNKDILVAAEDIEKIYGPYMELSVDGESAKFEMNDILAEVKPGSNTIKVNGERKEMSNKAELIGDKIFVPVGDLMKLAFDKYIASNLDAEKALDDRTWSRDNFIIAVCDSYEYKEVPGKYIVEKVPREGFEFDKTVIGGINNELKGKTDGELYKTYWFEEAKKVMTYSSYIPTTYKPEKPSKLVVALHGGGLGEQFIYSLSKNMVQFWSEKFNYIFIAPNACTVNSTYGNLLDPGGPSMNAVVIDDTSDNPYGFDEYSVTWRKLGEKGILKAIDAISAEYNIDKEHIFLQGNSMGGLGTFHLGSAYPEIFRAIAPFGIGLDPKFAMRYNLKNKPIRMVGGTEDPGFPRIKATYKQFKDAGYDIELDVVGGGVHFDSWAYVLEDTFKFFEKNS